MKKYILITALFFSLMVIEGCTDLEEEVLDESLTGGATPDKIADGAIAPVYAILPGLFLHGFWRFVSHNLVAFHLLG